MLGTLLSACGGGDATDSVSTSAEEGRSRALTAPPADFTYTFIAAEGSTFAVASPRFVRYGSGNTWIYRYINSTGQCTNEFFGQDPLYGVVKSCEGQRVTPPPAGTWTQVALEGGSFVTAGPQTVRYGAGSTWIEQTVNGAGQCTNAFFGRDPLFLVAKRCEVLNAAPPPATPWTQIAVEGGSFSVVGTQTVRYGANSSWIEKQVTGTGQCGVAFFGSDPLFGVLKRCELRSDGSTVPVAPSINTAPLSQTVALGNNGLFVVVASGSDPLTYQWFKNGVAIAGANGSDVLVPANAADAGGTYQITVQVSNSAGSVTSAVAVMSIALAPPNAGGTLITAAEGGEVVGGATGEEASLYVAPGALSANTTILLTTEPLAPSSLPAGVTAMSDIVEIKPAGLVFLKPASLSFLMRQNVPSDTGLVVVRLDANNNVLSQQARRVGVASVKATPTMKALSVNGRATASAVTVPGGLDCVGAQFVDGASKLTSNAITASGRLAVLAVPTTQCASIAVPASGSVPLDTNQACKSEAQFGGIGLQQPPGLDNDRESSLVNRHVDCRMATAFSEPTLTVDMLVDFDGKTRTFAPISADPNATLLVGVGKVKLEFQLSTFGPSGVLGKTLSYRARVVEFVPESPTYYLGPAITAIYLRSAAECTAHGFSFFPAPASATCGFAPIPIEVTTQRADSAKPYAWSKWEDMPVRFDWVNQSTSVSSYDIAVFRIKMDQFQIRVKGTDEQFRRPGNEPPNTTNSGLGYVPELRCDKNLAQVNTKGCVFHEAAAVYVLERQTESGDDSSVKEAAEHILEAQTYADETKRAPGRFILKAGTRAFADVVNTNPLQRAKSRTVQIENRKKSCSLATSLLNTRLPLNQSPKCAAGEQVCSCDEYPFASTWNGGNFRPERTSAKQINAKQNEAAGTSKVTNFYGSQRVLDFTLYPELVQPYDPNAESNRGGDDFWVFIK